MSLRKKSLSEITGLIFRCEHGAVVLKRKNDPFWVLL